MSSSDNGILQKTLFAYISWMKCLSQAIYFASTWSECKNASVKDDALPEAQTSISSLLIPLYCFPHLLVEDIAMSWCSIFEVIPVGEWLHTQKEWWLKNSVHTFLSKRLLVNEFSCQESVLHASKLNQIKNMMEKKLLSLRYCKLKRLLANFERLF